jgi:glycosyltransferase 2 family protein
MQKETGDLVGRKVPWSGISWNRTTWNRIGTAISLLIIAGACVVLFRLLRDIDLGKVEAALRATELRTVLIAGGFVALAYVTLTFYDFFSMRTIGRRDVPYRVAAFTGFLAYAIGHNLGATVLTANAIRYRVYSAWGLTLIDVAKIAFVTGLTFWLGNAFMLGLGMVYAPEAATALNQFPPWLNFAIGVIGLLIIVAYLIWLLPRPRAIGRGEWQIVLPSGRSTFVQIGIGILDLSVTSLAMYTLLPAEPSIGFVPVLVVFVMAVLLGFLSHAPGSLGVLEAAILIGLHQFDKEQVLAALLIYRALYFILPLCVAIVMLGVRELWLALRSNPS